MKPFESDDPQSWLWLEVTGDGDHRVVVLHGDLDLCTVDRFRTALQAVTATGAGLVVIDMADVGFLGVCGLTVLLDAKDALAQSGARLRLARLSRSAERLVRLAGVATTLGVDRSDQVVPAAPMAGDDRG